MNMRTIAIVLMLSGLLTACGSGSDTAFVDRGDDGGMNGGHMPGTSQTYVLVEVDPDEDIHDVVADTGGTVLSEVPGTPYYRVSIPHHMDVDEFQHHMKGDGRVINADLDMGMSAPEGDGSTLPAGGLMLASFIPEQDELLRIGVAEARMRTTGAGVRVAVLDSGVLPHEFLDGRVEPDGWDFVDEDPDPLDEQNFRDDDRDGLVDEGYGHGTFVASLILGVAPDARILPFRVLDSDAIGNASTIAAAITLAVDRGADVVNLSVSMEDRMKVIEDAVQSARDRGVLVIASAGNTGRDDVNFPAAISSAFSVTAVGKDDVLAPFASYGSEVDLAAPGVDVLGAYPSETGTARWSGTSFSAAILSGGFALVRQLHPGEDSFELLRRLEDTAFDIRPLNPEVGSKVGEGRLDVNRATAP